MMKNSLERLDLVAVHEGGEILPLRSSCSARAPASGQPRRDGG
jgi:hypothetical protein